MEIIILIIFGPTLLLPAIVGLYLILRPSHLRKFIGWFVFKPVLATPLFLLIYLGMGQSNPLAKYFSLLPGPVLTLLLLVRFREYFKGQSARLAFSLFILDLVRWGSAVLSVIFDDYTFCLGPNCPHSTWGPVLFLFTMAFPTLYAIIALILNRITSLENPLKNIAEVA